MPAARLRGRANIYKIKLRDAGYRLAYEVVDEVMVIYVLGVARRDEGYEHMLRIGRENLFDLD